ncbi:hypothetical protein Pmani_035470 [Petrolisthes manimaculis]|uniref:Laminin G domain-containing protein n=1 Tax=Petrolisthes manimaculis TaxID=1843537 RepID=A0AAE1NMW2_9EUCA|nr:hypothetical protein Pmani_035470 [Petrolisthes manimaculis]
MRVEVNASLHDSTWHSINLHLHHKSVSVVVDGCGLGWTHAHWDNSQCAARAEWVRAVKWAGNWPLQVGGQASGNPFTPTKHTACISHLTINGQLQDLGTPLPHHPTTCPPPPTTPSQGGNGDGQGECECLPTTTPVPPTSHGCGKEGRGDQVGACVGDCLHSPPAMAVTLTKDSYLTLALTFTSTPTPTQTLSAQISVKVIRPREKQQRSGLLLRLSPPHHHHTPTLILHLRAGVACVSLLGRGRVMGEACVVGGEGEGDVGDGRWHTVRGEYNPFTHTLTIILDHHYHNHTPLLPSPFSLSQVLPPSHTHTKLPHSPPQSSLPKPLPPSPTHTSLPNSQPYHLPHPLPPSPTHTTSPHMHPPSLTLTQSPQQPTSPPLPQPLPQRPHSLPFHSRQSPPSSPTNPHLLPPPTYKHQHAHPAHLNLHTHPTPPLVYEVVMGGVPVVEGGRVVGVLQDLYNVCVGDLRVWDQPLPMPLPPLTHTTTPWGTVVVGGYQGVKVVGEGGCGNNDNKCQWSPPVSSPHPTNTSPTHPHLSPFVTLAWAGIGVLLCILLAAFAPPTTTTTPHAGRSTRPGFLEVIDLLKHIPGSFKVRGGQGQEEEEQQQDQEEGKL